MKVTVYGKGTITHDSDPIRPFLLAPLPRIDIECFSAQFQPQWASALMTVREGSDHIVLELGIGFSVYVYKDGRVVKHIEVPADHG